MSEIKLTIELDEKLESLFSSILVIQSELLKRLSTPEQMTEVFKPQLTTPATEHPVDAVPPATVEDVKPAKAAEPEAPAKVYKFEEIQSAVMTACQNGKKAAVKELLNQYAKRVSELPQDKYTEFMTKLEAL